MNMGEKLTKEEVADMLKEADKNGDGVIDYDGKDPVLVMLFYKHMSSFAISEQHTVWTASSKKCLRRCVKYTDSDRHVHVLSIIRAFALH